ncbi:hypothetical protein HK102_006037 [Quaeritorhiza haematococci]|nr:hypothetical protein HK102_006037 [Quaeritorhiza haematococci]
MFPKAPSPSSAAFFVLAVTAAVSNINARPTPQQTAEPLAAVGDHGQVLRCQVTHEKQITELLKLEEEMPLDIWSHRMTVGKPVDVRVVDPERKTILENLFDSCSIMIEDVAQLIESTQKGDEDDFSDARLATDDPTLDAAADGLDFWRAYQSYDSIVAQLNKWATDYPNYVTFNASLGKSIEGRDIPMIKITDKAFDTNVNGTAKRGIWWNSGQHAREWIAPATVMYLINKLLTEAQTPLVSGFLRNAEFYVTPMQNPDGYEHTRTRGNRLHRKNKRINRNGSIGVDLNRNWDEHWGEVGSSGSPSSDTYRGTAPFSEPETKLLSDFILTIPNRYAGIDFHSYGQLVLRNWGWTTADSKNENILRKLGDGMSAAIKSTSGVSYTSMKGAELYPAAGATDDWMTAKAGMVGYTIELRDEGRYGFVLPPEQILPVGEETWAAAKYFVNFVLGNNIPKNEYLPGTDRVEPEPESEESELFDA